MTGWPPRRPCPPRQGGSVSSWDRLGRRLPSVIVSSAHPTRGRWLPPRGHDHARGTGGVPPDVDLIRGLPPPPMRLPAFDRADLLRYLQDFRLHALRHALQEPGKALTLFRPVHPAVQAHSCNRLRHRWLQSTPSCQGPLSAPPPPPCAGALLPCLVPFVAVRHSAAVLATRT